MTGSPKIKGVSFPQSKYITTIKQANHNVKFLDPSTYN